MSDLTDEELLACFDGGAHDKRAMRMAVEILRHRATVTRLEELTAKWEEGLLGKALAAEIRDRMKGTK